MNINKKIKDILNPLGVPVEFQTYSGDKSTYITFFCYNELGEVFAENKEKATSYYLQVDLWSKGDYIALADTVKSTMINAGFRRTSASDLYEKDTEIYHKAMRFIYTK